MTRDEAKELLPIMQAYANGEAIEYFFNQWREADLFGLSEKPSCYRIKPKPQVIYANLYPDCRGYVYKTAEDAQRTLGPNGITKKFIEVMDET